MALILNPSFGEEPLDPLNLPTIPKELSTCEYVRSGRFSNSFNPVAHGTHGGHGRITFCVFRVFRGQSPACHFRRSEAAPGNPWCLAPDLRFM